MADTMNFPQTIEEFMEQYKVVDTEQVYSNGVEFVPIFRVKQWFEHSEKHGQWIRKESKRSYWFECSECGYPPPLDKFKREWFSGYCPNCGTQMDEVEE